MRQLSKIIIEIIILLLIITTISIGGEYKYRYVLPHTSVFDTKLGKDYIKKEKEFLEWYHQEVKKPLMDRDFYEIERRRAEVFKAKTKLDEWLSTFKCGDKTPWGRTEITVYRSEK